MIGTGALREQMLVEEILQAREENRRLRERVLLLAKAFSLVSAGLPLDQLQTEEKHGSV